MTGGLADRLRLETFSGTEALREGSSIIEAYDVHHVPGDVWVAGEGTLHRIVHIPTTGHLTAR